MDLQQFLSEALRQIVDGVSEAQKAIQSPGAKIAPYSVHLRDEGQFESHESHVIEFDIAVTVAESTESTKGGGLKVSVLAAGIEGKSSASSETISRVRFSIPIILPAPKDNALFFDETTKMWVARAS